MILLPIKKLTNRGIECNNFYCDSFNNIVDLNFLIFENIEKNKYIVDFQISKYSIIEFILKTNVFHMKVDKNDNFMSYEIYSSYMKINFENGQSTKLCCYRSKFLQDFVNFEKSKILEMFDIEKCETCTRDAMSMFLKKITKNKNIFAQRKMFDTIFPQLENEEFEFLKKSKESVSAMFFRKVGEFKDIYSYDIKSSFPTRLYYGFFPKGNGVLFKKINEIPVGKWFVVKIKIIEYSVIKYDFLNFDNLDFSNGYIDYYATKETLHIIDNFYKCDYIVCYGYYYRLQKSIFDEFFEENIFNEFNSIKEVKKYNKGKSNLLIGNFGKRDTISVLKYSLNDDILKCTTESVEVEKKGYYPIYLYVNGLAKLEIIKIIYNHFEDIVYINTDGFFSKKAIDFSLYNLLRHNNMGVVEYRGIFKNIIIKDISNYFGILVDDDGVVKNDFRLSGRICNVENYNDFKNGNFHSLFYQISNYGFILPYEMKEESLEYYEDLEKYVKKMKFMEKYHLFSVKDTYTFKELKKQNNLTEIKNKLIQIFDSLFDNDKNNTENYKVKIKDSEIKTRMFIVKEPFSSLSSGVKYKKYDIIMDNDISKKELKICLDKKLIKELK